MLYSRTYIDRDSDGDDENLQLFFYVFLVVQRDNEKIVDVVLYPCLILVKSRKKT